MFLFALFFIIFRNQLPFLYNSNTDVVKIAGLLLIIAALFQVFDGMQATGIGVLRGITDVKIPLIISLFSYWIFGIPVSILLGFHFELGVYGIWIGLLLGLIFLGILLTVRFNYKTKKISVELS
jgi:MATE family multidrug resistance protein